MWRPAERLLYFANTGIKKSTASHTLRQCKSLFPYKAMHWSSARFPTDYGLDMDTTWSHWTCFAWCVRYNFVCRLARLVGCLPALLVCLIP